MELGAKMGLNLLALLFNDNGDVSGRDVAEGLFYHVIEDPFFA